MSCFNSHNFLSYLCYHISFLIFVNITDLLPYHPIEITGLILADETLGVKN